MVYAKNKKANFNYQILEKLEAGIVLSGTEVKSIRLSKVSIKESYIRIIRDEIFIMQMNISEYEKGNINNKESTRVRKLLLHKKEIEKLKRETKEKGLAIVPLSVYSNSKHIKVEIALAKGKKEYDKRETLKRKEIDMNIKREIKKYN